MAQNFIACDREQELLLPPSLRDWLPEDHLAWFVIDAVAEFDLAPFYGDYRADGHGRAAHDPAMMVALLLYAYARGERSSRLIERRLAEDVGYRVIAANQVPDHATIARFRVRHERALSGLFSQVLGLCAKAGMVAAGVIALDGTKLHAAASGQANMTYEQIAQAMLEDAARIDAEEDERYGEARGDELPAGLADPTSRRARLRAAKQALESEWQAERDAAESHNDRCQSEAEARAQGCGRSGRPRAVRPVPEAPTGRVNVTDPDSRPVRTHRGFVQGYNAQAAASQDQVIVAAEVAIGGTDQPHLQPMVGQARAELAAAGANAPPTTVLADSGYWSASQIEALRDNETKVLIPPEGESRRGPPQKTSPLAAEMREAITSENGRALYRQRQQIIEPIFGQTKANRRIDRFLRPGLDACRSEWRLICATHNLLKLWRHTPPAATG